VPLALALPVTVTLRVRATPAIAVKAPAVNTIAAVAVKPIAQAIREAGMAIVAVKVTAGAQVMPVVAMAARLAMAPATAVTGPAVMPAAVMAAMARAVWDTVAEVMEVQAAAAAGTGIEIFVVRIATLACCPFTTQDD
jgi:hypothetical protein